MDLRSEILAAQDSPLESFEVPEWKQTVFLRGLTLDERTAIANEANAMNGASEATKNNVLTRRLVQYGVCDSWGKRIFSDEDFEALGSRNANLLDRLGLKISALSKLGGDDVKELEKNSEPTQTADSASS